MRVSVQCHAPAALYIRYTLDRRLGELELVWTQRLEEKTFASAGNQTLVIKPVVCHYNALDTHSTKLNIVNL
jgi:hypothetical protein